MLVSLLALFIINISRPLAFSLLPSSVPFNRRETNQGRLCWQYGNLNVKKQKQKTSLYRNTKHVYYEFKIFYKCMAKIP